jgi:hypothetical protein
MTCVGATPTPIDDQSLLRRSGYAVSSGAVTVWSQRLPIRSPPQA